MMNLKNNTIDEIREKYKYKIDISDFLSTVDQIYDTFYIELLLSIPKYHFEENILKVKQIIDEKKTKLNKNKLKLYADKIKDISDEIEKLKKDIHEEYEPTWLFLYRLTKNYKENKYVPEALDLYEKMGKELLDKEAKKFINYEKTFLTINDKIIDIFNNLNNLNLC